MISPTTRSSDLKGLAERQSMSSPCKRVFQIWRDGFRIFARFFWFFFNLMIAMLPFTLLVDWISPEGATLFAGGRIHAAGIIVWIMLLIYLPFAAMLAARFSRQTFGKVLSNEGPKNAADCQCSERVQ